MTDNGDKDLIKGPWSWTDEDIKLLKRLYPQGNTKMIAERLCRPLTAVRQKAYDIGLKTEVYSYWMEEELEILSKLYPDSETNDLARRFRRSAGSVKAKARQLGLKKSQSYLEAVKSHPRKRHKKKPDFS